VSNCKTCGDKAKVIVKGERACHRCALDGAKSLNKIDVESVEYDNSFIDSGYFDFSIPSKAGDGFFSEEEVTVIIKQSR
jgi:hypothetical protein